MSRSDGKNQNIFYEKAQNHRHYMNPEKGGNIFGKNPSQSSLNKAQILPEKIAKSENKRNSKRDEFQANQCIAKQL